MPGLLRGIFVLCISVALAAGCAASQAPVLEPPRATVARVPVVVIPGVTGTRLRNVETGRVVWGKAGSVFYPRDGGYSLALPIDQQGDDPAVFPGIEQFGGADDPRQAFFDFVDFAFPAAAEELEDMIVRSQGAARHQVIEFFGHLVFLVKPFVTGH